MCIGIMFKDDCGKNKKKEKKVIGGERKRRKEREEDKRVRDRRRLQHRVTQDYNRKHQHVQTTSKHHVRKK